MLVAKRVGAFPDVKSGLFALRRTAVHLIIQKDGTYVLKFTPTYAGIHFLHVAVNNQPVKVIFCTVHVD